MTFNQYEIFIPQIEEKSIKYLIFKKYTWVE
jgi:hypothetical protein